MKQPKGAKIYWLTGQGDRIHHGGTGEVCDCGSEFEMAAYVAWMIRKDRGSHPHPVTYFLLLISL